MEEGFLYSNVSMTGHEYNAVIHSLLEDIKDSDTDTDTDTSLRTSQVTGSNTWAHPT